MTTLAKKGLWGIANAVGAAFVWALLVVSYNCDSFPGSLLVAGFAVLVAIWYVAPLGVIIGFVLPRLVERRSSSQAFIRGAIIGLIVAGIAALLTSIGDEWSTLTGTAAIVDREAWWRNVERVFLRNLVSMSFVCAVWLGVWAARMARKGESQQI